MNRDPLGAASFCRRTLRSLRRSTGSWRKTRSWRPSPTRWCRYVRLGSASLQVPAAANKQNNRACRVGYRAAWDTVPRGIPRRVGYRAAWDTDGNVGRSLVANGGCNAVAAQRTTWQRSSSDHDGRLCGSGCAEGDAAAVGGSRVHQGRNALLLLHVLPRRLHDRRAVPVRLLAPIQSLIRSIGTVFARI